MPPLAKPYIQAIETYVPGKSRTGATKLSSNENPLGCSDAARQALSVCLENTKTYPDGSCRLLREAIAQAEGINAEQIICGAGSDEIFGFICQAYLGEGDTIVQSRHGFLMYSIYAAHNGAKTLFAPENNLTVDVEAMLDTVQDTTKIVFLANPNNPTGTIISEQDIVRLRKGLPENVLLVLDGAYAEYVNSSKYSDGKKLAKATNNTIITRTFSKIHGLAALRAGWAYAHQDIINTLNKLRAPFNVTSPAQAAAAAAIADNDFVDRSRKFNKEERVKLEASLQKMGIAYTPSQGNFVLVHGPADKPDYATELFNFMSDRGVIIRQMGAYALPNALRISVGDSPENAKVCAVLEDFNKNF